MRRSVPVWLIDHQAEECFMSGATSGLTRRQLFVAQGRPAGFRPQGFLHHREPVAIGPFRVTPHLVDHSAFDAYSLLVDADGRLLFYTGDLRGHGRKGSLFAELLAYPPADVDVSLAEGTHVRATAATTTSSSLPSGSWRTGSLRWPRPRPGRGGVRLDTEP
jgi:mRNA degradation ribonuclease J1/J2